MSYAFERVEKGPAVFERAQLIAKDFDGTVAKTFEKSPHGIGVHEAYEYAIEDMFGINELELYINSGGLHNRAPAEVVQSLTQGTTEDELEDLTTQFINTKLAVLMGEIGERFADGSLWPRPTSGYLRFRELVEEARSEGRFIDDIILSSGHEPFISNTYKAWNVGEPTHVVAEETMRKLSLRLPMEQLVKPSRVLMETAHSIWRQGYGICSDIASLDEDRSRMFYIGDDPIKDGELARNSGVDFIWLDSKNSAEIWRSVAYRMDIGHAAIRGGSENV